MSSDHQTEDSICVKTTLAGHEADSDSDEKLVSVKKRRTVRVAKYSTRISSERALRTRQNRRSGLRSSGRSTAAQKPVPPSATKEGTEDTPYHVLWFSDLAEGAKVSTETSISCACYMAARTVPCTCSVSSKVAAGNSVGESATNAKSFLDKLDEQLPDDYAQLEYDEEAMKKYPVAMLLNSSKEYRAETTAQWKEQLRQHYEEDPERHTYHVRRAKTWKSYCEAEPSLSPDERPKPFDLSAYQVDLVKKYNPD